MNDPKVLSYWEDWLKVRDSAVMTGWTFAGYVAARAAQEHGAKLIYSDSTSPTIGPGWYRG